MSKMSDLHIERQELIEFFDSYDVYMYHIAMEYYDYVEIMALTEQEFNDMKG